MKRRTWKGAVGSAFTLIDLMVTLAVLAIVVAVAAPAMSPDERARLRGGAMMLASDLEYAQSVSLATPGDPALVRFAADQKTYWLAPSSAPNEALYYPGTQSPYLTVFGVGRAALLSGVEITVTGVADPSTLGFDGFARPTSLEDVVLELRGASSAVRVRVSASSGSITIE